MVKSLVLKDFHDIQQDGKRFAKDQIHFTNNVERAKDLVSKGYLKLLEIEAPKQKEDEELTFKELKAKYPDIKAKNKKSFLEQL